MLTFKYYGKALIEMEQKTGYTYSFTDLSVGHDKLGD